VFSFHNKIICFRRSTVGIGTEQGRVVVPTLHLSKVVIDALGVKVRMTRKRVFEALGGSTTHEEWRKYVSLRTRTLGGLYGGGRSRMKNTRFERKKKDDGGRDKGGIRCRGITSEQDVVGNKRNAQ